MQVSGYGNARTREGRFGINEGETVNTAADINIFACTRGCGSNQPLSAGYGTDNNTGLLIPTMTAPFQVNNATVSGTRLNSANVNAIANIPDIPINYNSGQLGVKLESSACVLFLLCVSNTFMKLETNLQGLKADINFNESLVIYIIYH